MTPVRVLVVDDSAFARKVLRESLLTNRELEALALGVFDLVHKPTSLASDSLRDVARELIAKVLLAGRNRSRVRNAPSVAAPVAYRIPSDRVVLIGTSTGGPQALNYLLPAIPVNFPAPIVVVVHIPPGYTESLAARLNAESAIEVVEAVEGLGLRPGLAIIGRSGRHLRVLGGSDGHRVHLAPEPRDSLHCPSVDVLFESAASTLGPRALAVVLTGMGDDGLAGSRAIVAAGGQVLTQDEESCVVHGMPRVVLQAGLSSADVALERMLTEISARL